MIGNSPTPGVRNTPTVDPHNTFRASHTREMWISSPAIPNRIDVIYNIGIPIVSHIGLFTIQNRTLNADLQFYISLPTYLLLNGTNHGEILLPRNSNVLIEIMANEQYLKHLNPTTKTGLVTITVSPLNYEGPVFVQNHGTLHSPNHTDVTHTDALHSPNHTAVTDHAGQLTYHLSGDHTTAINHIGTDSTTVSPDYISTINNTNISLGSNPNSIGQIVSNDAPSSQNTDEELFEDLPVAPDSIDDGIDELQRLSTQLGQ